MTLKYESEILFDLMKRDGDNAPSDVLPYESELIEKYLHQVEGAYPKLQDYRSEWLNYNLMKDQPADFPSVILSNVTEATVHHVVPYAYTSAILKGQTLVNKVTAHGFGGNPQIYESRFHEQPFNPGDIFTVFVVNPNVTTVVVGLSNSVTGSWTGEKTYDVSSNKKITVTIPSGSMCNYTGVVVSNRNDSSGFENSLVVVEGDQTHLNIDTYFEGMQSVRMPSLITSNGDGTKTNILTVNEDVTLRSNGNVYDELDCLTGKLTQRIGEDGEVLPQEVVKSVDITVTDQDGNINSIIKPIEGTMQLMTEGDTICPLFSGEIPVEAITQNLSSFIEE